MPRYCQEARPYRYAFASPSDLSVKYSETADRYFVINHTVFAFSKPKALRYFILISGTSLPKSLYAIHGCFCINADLCAEPQRQAADPGGSLG